MKKILLFISVYTIFLYVAALYSSELPTTPLSPRRQIRSLPVGVGHGIGAEVQRMVLGSIGKAAGNIAGHAAASAAEAALQRTQVSGTVAGVRFTVGGRRSSDESDSSALRRSASHEHLSTPRGMDHQAVQPRVPALKISSDEGLQTREGGASKGSRKHRSRSGSSSDQEFCDPKTKEHEEYVARLQQQIGTLIPQLHISPDELKQIQDINRSRAKRDKDKRFQDCKNLEAIIKMLELMQLRRNIVLPERNEDLRESIKSMPETARTRVFGFMTEEEFRQCLIYVASGVAVSIASSAASAAVGKTCSIQ